MGAMRSRPFAAALLVSALLVAGCGASDEAGPGDPPSDGASPSGDLAPEIGAYVALCSVQVDAAAQDVATAEATFRDEVHETLHHLADEVETVDRAIAAGLLQAKSSVEADFAEDAPDPATTAADVQELLSAMGNALEAVGFEAPGCLDQPQ